MEQAMVTGAAGFIGANLVERLLEEGIEVFAVVRPKSSHNERLRKGNLKCHLVECEADAYGSLAKKVKRAGWANGKESSCFHLVNAGEGTVGEQLKNISYAIEVLEAANFLGCRRFVATGSQAEYGVVPPDTLIDEALYPKPITAYG